MSKLNMKEWINEIIQKKEVVAMPIMTHPGIEMIGKTVRDAVTDGQVHYNAIKALSEKYPTAAATVIMDLTVEAEAFGAEIVFPENEVPSVVGRLLANRKSPPVSESKYVGSQDNNGQTCLCRLHRPLLIGRTFV